jgi:Tol biopolymer transport system component
MSPEQVNGKHLDSRSDIFSLGSVLYEMVAGRRAFDEKTQSGVLSAILEKDPAPLAAVAPRAPAALDRLIRRCLAKDPEERWQAAQDIASELEWIGEKKHPSPALQPRGPAFGVPMVWMLCGIALGAALLAGILSWHNRSNASRESYFLALLPFTAHNMAVAPNGHTVAVVGFSESTRTNDLWIYETGSQEQKRLPDSDGASFPFWSPDGKSLGFFADGKLKKFALAGGPVQIICDAAAGRGGTWNKDGVIVFSPSGQLGGGLYRVSAAGGTAARITTPDAARGENSDRWPVFLPDGKHFLYLAANVSGQTDPDAIFVGALDSNERKFLIRATGNPAYVNPGYLLFCREKTLYAQQFDPNKLALSGEAVPLLRDVSYLPRILHNAFASSQASVLVAQRGTAASLSKLAWLDRKGNEIGTVGKPGMYANLSLAPGGNIVAFDKTDEANQNADVWTYDLRRNTMKRLTFDPAIDADPVWSPDGKRILFASSRSGLFQIYAKNADGSEDEQLLPIDASDKADKYPSSWSSDGAHLLYERTTQPTIVWNLDMPGLRTSALFKGTATTKSAQFSPDRKWVAYTSNENGEWEIYVTSFPDGRGKWQISSGGGVQPRWRGDGKELFYLASDGKMMAVPVTIGEHFDAGAPQALFQANARTEVAGSELITYDVTKDGLRFLMNTPMEKAQTQPMTIVLNWPSLMQK